LRVERALYGDMSPNDDTSAPRSLHIRRALGAAIRAERKRRGLTQLDLADASGITRSALISLERGASSRVDTLARVAVALGLDIRLVARAEE
jgi:transcriptional regulator with XRE-family HTH domain